MYAIGTKFISGGKAKNECTVIDIHTTRNMAGEIVKQRYVATHAFLGQIVEDCDVNDVTIARGIARGQS